MEMQQAVAMAAWRSLLTAAMAVEGAAAAEGPAGAEWSSGGEAGSMALERGEYSAQSSSGSGGGNGESSASSSSSLSVGLWGMVALMLMASLAAALACFIGGKLLMWCHNETRRRLGGGEEDEFEQEFEQGRNGREAMMVVGWGDVEGELQEQAANYEEGAEKLVKLLPLCEYYRDAEEAACGGGAAAMLNGGGGNGGAKPNNTDYKDCCCTFSAAAAAAAAAIECTCGAGTGAANHYYYKKGAWIVDQKRIRAAISRHNSTGFCAVCLSRFRDGQLLRILPDCSHSFHVHCIDTWFKSRSTCPLCRRPITPTSIPLPLLRRSLSYASSSSSNSSTPAMAAAAAAAASSGTTAEDSRMNT